MAKNYVMGALPSINRGRRGKDIQRRDSREEEEEADARDAEEGEKEDKKTWMEQYNSLKVGSVRV